MEAAGQGSSAGNAGSGAESTLGPHPPPPGQGTLASERPELFVGAAFVGGLLAARVLKLVRR